MKLSLFAISALLACSTVSALPMLGLEKRQDLRIASILTDAKNAVKDTVKNAIFSTEAITGSRVIKGATLAKALPLVQNPEVILSLNPILISKTKDASDSLKYTIKEKLALGPIQSSTTFTAKFVIEKDGLRSIVNAGAGTELNGRWSVKAVSGGVELKEDTSVKGVRAMMSFIMGTAKKSHAESLDALAKKIQAAK